MLSAFTPRAKQHALFVTGGFALLGLLSMFFSKAPFFLVLPCVLFFGLILLNTFFSVRIFTSITPQSDRFQKCIDLLLIILYCGMVFTLGQLPWFYILTGAMFIAATIKYVMLAMYSPHQLLLRHKIFFDVAGAIGSVLVLGITQMGYPLLALWGWLIIFAIAQIDIFIFHPLYVFDASKDGS